jgi:hypothetical protein
MGQPTTYRILIEGQLGPEWTSWFVGLTVRPGPDGTTVLRGQLADQAALHGLLAAIRDLGLSLVSVETISRSTDPLPLDPDVLRSCRTEPTGGVATSGETAVGPAPTQGQ